VLNAVNEDAVLQEAKALQREAVLCYNNQQFAEAEARFRDVHEVMKLLFPPTHPEVIKAEKSVQLVQRKAAQQSSTGFSAAGGVAADSGRAARPGTSGGYRY
jgi:hypothetical protein